MFRDAQKAEHRQGEYRRFVEDLNRRKPFLQIQAA